MRSSVRLRAYGQRDPLIEYKNEGARMFKTLLENIDVPVTAKALVPIVAPPKASEVPIAAPKVGVTNTGELDIATLPVPVIDNSSTTPAPADVLPKTLY